MKKILSIILAVFLVIAVMPIGVFNIIASAETSDYLLYNVQNSEATITYAIESISGDAEIPSTLGGYPVTGIGYGAFTDCIKLESVTIPSSVTNIDPHAFKDCTNLKTITIPSSVTSIGDSAFEGCTSFENVYITDIAAWCNIDFEGRSSNPLENADNLYLNGKLVKNIVIPNGVTNIPRFAFGCTNLESITIPNGVTSIGEGAFCGCTNLESITIPGSVTSIGNGAFYECTSFESVEIPKSVTSIGIGAFSGCHSLKSIAVDNENKVYYSKGNCLIEKETNTLFMGFDNSVIPESVTSIGDFAFCETNIKSIVIPGSVTNICYSAFSDCTNLESITIGNGVKSIDYYAFSGCWALNSIILTKNTTNIEAMAFLDCGLEKIYFKGTSSDWNSMEYAEDEQFAGVNIIYICEGEHTYDNADDLSCNKCEFVKADVLNNFPDTSNNTWYSAAVRYVVENGIMTGYSNGYFGTANGIQRQDFLVILARLDGVNLDDYSYESSFPDVGDNTYYQAAVNWGYENGIVNGYENGRFGVGDFINREQIVTFLYRYAQYKGLDVSVSAESAQATQNQYADYDNVSDYAKDAVLWAIDRGVISGKNNGTAIHPAGTAQRCEIAQIMYNINKNSIF